MTRWFVWFFIVSIAGCNLGADPEGGPSYEPFDHLHFQRSFPLSKLDLEAFHIAMEEAGDKKRRGPKTQDWLLEGPTNMGGRLNCIEVDPEDEEIIYVGSAAGGVFKTINGGEHWFPITDDFAYLPIGDITIDPSNRNIVYVGTGDPNITGTPHIGNGIYKSEDAGQTWIHLGLEEQRIISKICVHPTNGQIVYAAAMGLPFERNNERGLYRSTDGGHHWEQVLFISDDAGVIDLVMHAENPDILYASGWNRIRNNEESILTGTGAKVFKTTDGGQNWTVLSNGLPTAARSRVGLATSQADPNEVFALYIGTDQQLDGVYRTVDGGSSWQTMNTTGLNMGMMYGYGWYFGKIRVNPKRPEEISILGVDMYTTFNGGQTWQRSVPEWWRHEVHADKHDMVYLPSGAVLLATDGGLYRSDSTTLDTWHRIDDIPNTQLYHVAINPHEEGVYASGAQDNGTLEGDHASMADWRRLYGGDGLKPIYDTQDPDHIYCEYQRGGLVYVNRETGEGQSFTTGIDPSDRRNWNMPYVRSFHDDQRFYCGTYRVYRHEQAPSGTWAPISDDLTDGVIYGNAFHTISAVAESPLASETLYAGTTDANVWCSRNGGSNWENVTPGLPNHYVTDIKGSPTSSSTVFVTHSGYKMNEYIPHVHRSDDHGETWVDISGDLPQTGVNQIEVLNENVLFVATDDGVYGTENGGVNWIRLGNMPLIMVSDIEIDLTRSRIVAGTFSRSVQSYPIDEFLDGILVGMNEGNVADLSVYPNPAIEVLHVNNGSTPNRVEVFNSSGELVVVKEQYRSGDPIRIGQLETGVFIVRSTVENTSLSARFLKIE